MTSFRPLDIRRSLGKHDWGIPREFGPDGWIFDNRDGQSRIIISAGPHPDSGEWWHASISHTTWMPSYDELVLLHKAVWGTTGWAYQVFAPSTDHVNIHSFALHLWGRPDGSAILPNFGIDGTI